MNPQAWLADMLARLPDPSPKRIQRTHAPELAISERRSRRISAVSIRSRRPNQGPSPDAYLNRANHSYPRRQRRETRNRAARPDWGR
nr:hypothetical protein [Bradyrhizobium japonicum]